MNLIKFITVLQSALYRIDCLLTFHTFDNLEYITVTNRVTYELIINGNIKNKDKRRFFFLVNNNRLLDVETGREIVLCTANIQQVINLVNAHGDTINISVETETIGGLYGSPDRVATISRNGITIENYTLTKDDIRKVLNYIDACSTVVNGWLLNSNQVTKIGCTFVRIEQLKRVLEVYNRLSKEATVKEFETVIETNENS